MNQIDQLINRLHRNTKNQLKAGIILSICLLIIFFVLQYFNSNLLRLENRWIVVALLPIILSLLYTGKINKVKFFDFEIEVVTSKSNLENIDKKIEHTESLEKTSFPSDYFYINHTSFYRKEEQTELQEKTGLKGYKLYDIRVKVCSYYKGALEKIDRVEYYLHSSYPDNKIVTNDKKSNFLLKELAYGEYVLSAKVFLKGIEQPFILQRYITLSESGPRI